MKERPILFPAPMVRALLAGTKTQTRRVVKGLSQRFPLSQLVAGARFDDPMAWGWKRAEDGADAPLGAWLDWCPYGKPGDRLWVRETWGIAGDMPHDPGYVEYRANCKDGGKFNDVGDPVDRWRPSIHMPRTHARINLEISKVCVERLQSISAGDCFAEGIEIDVEVPAKTQYARLWESINGAGSWNANPWVWVVEFKRLESAA